MAHARAVNIEFPLNGVDTTAPAERRATHAPAPPPASSARAGPAPSPTLPSLVNGRTRRFVASMRARVPTSDLRTVEERDPWEAARARKASRAVEYDTSTEGLTRVTFQGRPVPRHVEARRRVGQYVRLLESHQDELACLEGMEKKLVRVALYGEEGPPPVHEARMSLTPRGAAAWQASIATHGGPSLHVPPPDLSLVRQSAALNAMASSAWLGAPPAESTGEGADGDEDDGRGAPAGQSLVQFAVTAAPSPEPEPTPEPTPALASAREGLLARFLDDAPAAATGGGTAAAANEHDAVVAAVFSARASFSTTPRAPPASPGLDVAAPSSPLPSFSPLPPLTGATRLPSPTPFSLAQLDAERRRSAGAGAPSEQSGGGAPLAPRLDGASAAADAAAAAATAANEIVASAAAAAATASAPPAPALDDGLAAGTASASTTHEVYAARELTRFERMTHQVLGEFRAFLKKVGEDDLDAADISLFAPALAVKDSSARQTQVRRVGPREVPLELAQRMWLSRNAARARVGAGGEARGDAGAGASAASGRALRKMYLLHRSRLPPPAESSFGKSRMARPPVRYGAWYAPVSTWQPQPADGRRAPDVRSSEDSAGESKARALREKAEAVARLPSTSLFLNYLLDCERRDPERMPVPAHVRSLAGLTAQAERDRQDERRVHQKQAAPRRSSA